MPKNFRIILLIICTIAANRALAHRPGCEALLAPSTGAGTSLNFSPLRSDRDPRFYGIVNRIRSSFKPGASGYVLIPLAEAFSLNEYSAIYSKLPTGYQFEWAINFDGRAATLVKPISELAKRRHQVPDTDDEFVRGISLPEDFLGSVVEDAHVLEAAINEAQAGLERVEIATVNIRTFASGDKVSKVNDSREFHLDGGYMTFSWAPKGVGTLYTEEQSTNPIDVRQAASTEGLLLTNLDRAHFSGSRPTFHASPLDHGDRLLILIRFRNVK